jgi:hypothetical protein
MLSLPAHRRHLHRTVWVTLMSWVFALLAGMANACQVQSYGPRAPASATSTYSGLTERGVNTTQAFYVEHGDDDGRAKQDGPTRDAAKAGCLKFCDDESSSATKAKTAQTDVPVPVVVASVDWRSVTPTATVATWRLAERPAFQGLPLVIRFLRLTI